MTKIVAGSLHSKLTLKVSWARGSKCSAIAKCAMGPSGQCGQLVLYY